MKNLRLSIGILFLLVSISQAQQIQWREGGSYSKARVYLSSGEMIQSETLYVLASGIKVISKASPEPRDYPFEDIQKVEIPTKNNLFLGGLIGTAVGAGVMLLAESNYEKPKTTHESGPGWDRTTTTTKEMPFIEKVPIVAGGTLIGAVIGYTIDSGWKKIYPIE